MPEGNGDDCVSIFNLDNPIHPFISEPRTTGICPIVKEFVRKSNFPP